MAKESLVFPLFHTPSSLDVPYSNYARYSLSSNHPILFAHLTFTPDRSFLIPTPTHHPRTLLHTLNTNCLRAQGTFLENHFIAHSIPTTSSHMILSATTLPSSLNISVAPNPKFMPMMLTALLILLYCFLVPF